MYEIIDGVKRKVELVHKSQIKNGDCIFYNGKYRTIDNKYIKHDSFMGVTLFGDSFKSGYEKVKRVVFPRWFQGKKLN